MPARVVIAGAGIAAVEAALGLRDLVGDRVDLVLVSPGRELRHRALGDAPWTLGGVRRHRVERVAGLLKAELVPDAAVGVAPDARRLLLRGRVKLGYDVLLIAVGARRIMSLDHAVVFGSSLDVPAVNQVLRLARTRRAKCVATVVPPGVAWSLPAYEVALRAAEAGAGAVVITPESRPAAAFGDAAVAVAEVLRRAGVEVVRGTAVDAEEGSVLLTGDDGSVEADAVVALPWVRGPRIDGVPRDADGFIPVDAHGAVEGTPGVYAAGDATTFPIREGGLACQQAEAAAAAIAVELGAATAAEPMRPVLRGALPTPDGPLWLEHDFTTGRATASHQPPRQPAHRVAGTRLPAFLERLERL